MIPMLAEYPYLYETHLHTSEASACALSTGEEMARACRHAGYTGIIVTNHNWHGNHCIDDSLSWEEYVLTNGDTWYDTEGEEIW